MSHTVIAVAGGTGGVGRTIVQQLALHQAKYKVIVLTRNVSVDNPMSCLSSVLLLLELGRR